MGWIQTNITLTKGEHETCCQFAYETDESSSRFFRSATLMLRYALTLRAKLQKKPQGRQDRLRCRAGKASGFNDWCEKKLTEVCCKGFCRRVAGCRRCQSELLQIRKVLASFYDIMMRARAKSDRTCCAKEILTS